jgi:hypothetical protein
MSRETKTYHDHKVGDIWYRYESRHNVFFENKLPFPNEYVVVRVTPFFVYIQPVGYQWPEPKKMMAGSNQSWAKPTLSLALESFVYRSKRAIQHYTRKIEETRATLKGAEKMRELGVSYPKELSTPAAPASFQFLPGPL